MSATVTTAVGAPVDRVDGRAKATGEAQYAFEIPVDGVAYCAPVQSRVARGRILGVDGAAARALPGVLTVISFENAPRLKPAADRELDLFQTDQIAYYGQIVAAVVAESLETAREAAGLVRIDAQAERHDVVLSAHDPHLFKPDTVNPNYATDTALGDFDHAFEDARVQVDETYTTPAYHNNPMEPHATTAVWDGGALTLYDSTQSVHNVRETVARIFDLPLEHVRVVSQHVGGGFGSKGMPHPHVILAAVAALLAGRPVKLSLTRQQLFACAGYRTPTIQRVRLGANRDGRLEAIAHDVIEQTSRLKDFAEQTAVATRVMYEAENRRTTHRVARLDVPTPSWMRAPGECPGMYALESAMDELAIACGVDPVELRIRNDPPLDPEERRPWSSRHLVECLREGAERFGWEGRDPTPAVRRDGRWLVGTGVASSLYPAYQRPSGATARAEADGRFTVRIGAADIGTGARTALTQLAADALEVPFDHVHVELGDSALPHAPVAGGSMGTASWGAAVVEACTALREQLDGGNGEALEVTVDTEAEVARRADLSRYAFGAQFAEARVDVDTGETIVPRLLGVFAAGRIVNPKTARSQFIGGMTMGLSMALHEESLMDREFGDYANHDLAGYHIATVADVLDIDAAWVDEDDPHVPLGIKGIGEIGIVGTAAAIANAVHHATGIRIRDLPIRPDKLLR